MLQTLSGWVGNALDKLRLIWAEPLTWLILLGRRRRRRGAQVPPLGDHWVGSNASWRV